jgi:D-tyrosyl-tRNA(Tyr) deacylase
LKAIIQRVSCASVSIDNKIYSQIDEGALIFLGVYTNDNETNALALAKKVASLRFFDDDKNIPNLSLIDTKFEVLVVSQFTICANTTKGNRPSFISASEPAKAEFLYNLFNNTLISILGSDKIFTGKFKSIMKISLTNEGPFTLIIEK